MMALIKCPECKKKISNQCEKCPQCGYPIKGNSQNENIEIENNGIVVPVKKPFYKKVWVWIVAGAVLVALVFGIVLLFNQDTKPKFDKEGNPVFIELTNKVYTNAKEYKGYHINIKGQVFQVMSENGSVKGIQIWLDPDTCEQNIMIYYNNDAEVKQGDYIVCSGYIDSVTEYKNAYDAKLYAPLIISSDLKKSTYMEVMAPAKETIVPENLKQEKYGYSVSIDKIEFAEKETRVYATATNNGKALLYMGDFVIIQDGKQYNSKNNYDADYEEIPYEIVKGASSSGIIVFPAIDANDFELTIDIHSDNYDEEIENIMFKISKNSTTQEHIETKPNDSKPTTNYTTSTTTETEKQEAIDSAKYLFSSNNSMTRAWLRDWLINVDGYSYDIAQYAVENASLDWSNHALIYAKEGIVLNPNIHSIPVNITSISESLLEQEFKTDEINYAVSSIDWNQYALDYLYLLETWGDVSTKEDAEERLFSYGFSQEQINYAINNCSIQWQSNDADE